MKTLERILRENACIHCFRSGGGLRIVTLEKDDKLLGYGENLYFEKALEHCEEDAAAGQRYYNDVYGEIHEHYLTGSSTPSSNVDRWVLMGRDIDINFENDLFVFNGKYKVDSIPIEITKRVADNGFATTYVDNRGFVYFISPHLFASGEVGSSAQTIFVPTGRNEHDAFWHNVDIKIGANSLYELFEKMEAEFGEIFLK